MSLTSTLLALMIAAAAPKPATFTEAPAPYPFTAYFQSDPLPEEVTPTGNPLDWAGAKIGLDVRGYNLPRGWEGEYRFVARFPIIDAVANRPLYLKQWTEESAERLAASQLEHGVSAAHDALGLLCGEEVTNPMVEPDYRQVKAFEAALKETPLSRKYIKRLVELFESYSASSEAITQALQVGATTPKSRSAFRADDSAYFRDKPVAYLLPDDVKMADLTGNTDSQMEYIRHLRRLRLDRIMSAGNYLSEAVQTYIDQTKVFSEAAFFKDGGAFTEFLFPSKYGLIVIAGSEADTHTRDAAIMIDLGGDDVYSNNSGGAMFGAAICIDHSGRDRYDAGDRRYAQGCGLFGVGILADLAGDDAYTAKHFSQGAGIAGVGILYDRGGNDTYSGHGFTQGAAMFGLGMLLDDSGVDSYDCATLSQGGATCLGLGILSDLGGNDKYKLGTDSGKDAFSGMPGYGQGGALSFRPSPWRGKFTPYGGVGMLIDKQGDDDYLTTGWCDQGGSYIMSLGALYDGAGNDRYQANTGQGSGIHITNAILVDKAGNDSYQGAFRSGGSGGDRSVGMLLDYAGDDTYKAGSSSYGTGCKPYSYSLMIDYAGKDSYITANPVGPVLFNCWDSFGGVWPESAPNLYPWAICLDLGGEDDYQVRNRKNNSNRHSFGHGVQLDMEWKGGDVIGAVENPLTPYLSLRSPGDDQNGIKPFGSTPDEALYSPNLFARFHAIGQILQDSSLLKNSLPYSYEFPKMPLAMKTADRLAMLQHDRDRLEVLHYYLVERRLPAQVEPLVAGLLNSPNSEVRIIIADDIGVFGLKSCESALVGALKDEEPQVRRFAFRSLIALKSEKGLEAAQVAVSEDASEDVRRLALAYLVSRADSCPPYQVLTDRLEKDSASAVRVAAADALGRLGSLDAVPVLTKASGTSDVYLQRAVAKALCELGEVEGIGMLIESLSFPSIDAFFNYDYNVPNFISTYSGHDFPDPDRYNQDKWREWFAANKGNIDLKGNIAASRAFASLSDSLRGASDSLMIARLEQFVRQYPRHRNAAGTLAAQLNRIAWDMATAPRGEKRFNPAQAISYSRRSCELVPEPNYWDTLAEAYFAAGDFVNSAKVCDEQLLLSPGNRMFLDRLEKIKGMKE